MAKDFTAQQVVEGYDDHIRKLIPGYEVVHQQIQAILKAYLPEQAHILIVGCGTGYELRYLLENFPNWQFTATDLSAPMLKKARTYIQDIDLHNRVRFVLGDIQVLNQTIRFDAALSILVTHFVSFQHKAMFLHGIHLRLKENALFLTFDLVRMQTDKEKWVLKNICESNGLTENQTTAMLARLTDDFYPLSESQSFEQLQRAGFKHISRFTQILCYQGFIAFA
ncbi:class I SAM-dependent methyltransferase [Acinetobacter ihumii]|uniref:class I SAM-dependent methyltransferase n=1 Tax=Acinetobacter ihumii TaxID=2483802 RepID=UPI001030EA0B|nr:class I SAM-dependent methyltransferase [Acinetobacter ihumii]